MVKKKSHCVIGGCPATAKSGAKVCSTHLHPLALQSEIERLKDSHDNSHLQALLSRFPDLRTIIEQLAELSRRAEPLKGANIEVVARSRGHGLGDGIVVLGNDDDHGYQPTMPAYAVASSRDRGKLGAAVAEVGRCANQLKTIASPGSKKRRDDRPRCGRKGCSGQWIRQTHGIRFCGYCAREMAGAA